MDIVGLDLHKRESQLASTAPDGTITDRRIVTSRDRLTAVFGDRPRARILLEASTESEWVARHLEALGHEVIVADPNVAPMSATRSRRTTTAYRLLRGPIQYIGPLLRSQHDWQISPAWVPEVGPGRSVSFSA